MSTDAPTLPKAKTQWPISPCQAICKYDDEDVCIGCFRRKQDIENWYFLDEPKKYQILQEVEPKIAAARARKQSLVK